MKAIIQSSLLLSALTAGLMTSCSKQETTGKDPHSGSKVLAIVNGQAITEADFRSAWSKRPSAADSSEHRQEFLDRLVDRHALEQAAIAEGLMEDPLVKAQIQSFLIGRLRETQLNSRIEEAKIGDEEIQAYFDENPDEFQQDSALKAAVLWFDTRGHAPLEARYRARLEKVKTALADTPEEVPVAEGFGSFATKNSEHRTSRYQGGRLGWLKPDGPSSKFHGTVAEIAATLERPGDLSDVIVRPEGAFLVRLLERRDTRLRTLEEVRLKIEKQLLSQKRDEIEKHFHDEKMKQVEIVSFRDRLDAIDDLPSSRPSKLQLSPALSSHPGR